MQISIKKAGKQKFVLTTICHAPSNNNKQKLGYFEKMKNILSVLGGESKSENNTDLDSINVSEATEYFIKSTKILRNSTEKTKHYLKAQDSSR